MSRVNAIPRISLTWLLVAQVLVIIPHLTHLPLWIIGLWLGSAAWRIQIFRMRARYPNAWAKGGLMLVAALGVFLSRGSLIGLDAGTVLLIAAFILKFLEMRSRRDALLLIFLGFFVVVTAYLFDDSMLIAFYSLLPVTALLAALIGLQQSSLAEQPWPTARLAGGLLLQALPVMLLLFVFFPRMSPLWSLPVSNGMATTGLSDSMAPADIADLSRSAALAFRASFNGETPPRSELYWRALTLDRFDGRRWSQSDYAEFGPGAQWQKQGDALSYSIVMQPSGQRWLFALDVAQTSLEQTRQMSDFRLQRRQPVDRSLIYQATSWPQALREPQLPQAAKRRALQLPDQGEPRSRAWAEQLKREHPQPKQLVQALLSHFNREPFTYTLRPSRLGLNNIDDFLFATRRGFCAHYAGAMTYVLRAAGIPARVVAGYQGGEYNPAGNYVQVRQFDAHAWVEYWQEGQGWVSVDPTFQVAPERIEMGLEEALADEQSFLEDSLFSPLRYRNLIWLNEMRLAWDNINYGWQRWVLGYQSQQQLAFLQRWLGRVDAQSLVIGLVGGGALLLGLLSLWLFKPWQRERDVQQRLFRRFEGLLARHGVPRKPGEGPRDYAARAARQMPAQAGAIANFAATFEVQRYAGQEPSVAQLRQHLKALKRALPWRLTRLEP
ncbi:transglutaminase TgpA family protein [Pseudomonas sp. EA_35y_Pfl2_R111]|uniref:transglutaminase TgpA family protein n=1 Tax=Pseudomonas sp. EA_35y_Pfl2_R111 TaxID=3088689 RepID=UPI0030DCB1CC